MEATEEGVTKMRYHQITEDLAAKVAAALPAGWTYTEAKESYPGVLIDGPDNASITIIKITSGAQ